MSEDHTELERQVACVVGLLQGLCHRNAKGSITVHLDGGGNIGKVIDVNLKEWRDKFSPVDVGREVGEEEFSRILRQQKHKEE